MPTVKDSVGCNFGFVFIVVMHTQSRFNGNVDLMAIFSQLLEDDLERSYTEIQ